MLEKYKTLLSRLESKIKPSCKNKFCGVCSNFIMERFYLALEHLYLEDSLRENLSSFSVFGDSLTEVSSYSSSRADVIARLGLTAPQTILFVFGNFKIEIHYGFYFNAIEIFRDIGEQEDAKTKKVFDDLLNRVKQIVFNCSGDWLCISKETFCPCHVGRHEDTQW